MKSYESIQFCYFKIYIYFDSEFTVNFEFALLRITALNCSFILLFLTYSNNKKQYLSIF